MTTEPTFSMKISKSGHRCFTFHVLTVTHLPCSRKYMSCAFTQKVHKLCAMLLSKGHRVILYACEGSDAPCSEFVQTHTLAELRAAFGDKDYAGKEEIGYEWQKEHFRFDFDKEIPLTRAVRMRTLGEMEMRKSKDDFLLCSMGLYHQELAKQSGLHLVCESGIGYYAVFAPYRAYESTFVRHFSRGAEGKGHATDGMNYYRVIPNYYPLSDFPFVRKPQGDANGEPYFLVFSRMIHRKGVGIAIDATRAANARLIICGQGGKYDADAHTLQIESNVYQLTAKQTYLGYADAEMRKYLMGNATATICSTIYMEPFCGTNAESQLCGTPVISTDFGAFTDTVEHGRTGFRCCTMNDFVLAVKNAHRLDREHTARRARSLWADNVVNEQYEKFWQDAYDVFLSTMPEKRVDAVTGELRKQGFYNVRTPEEESQAGTANAYFSPQAPYDQIKPMPGVDSDEPAPMKVPDHPAMRALVVPASNQVLLQRLAVSAPLSAAVAHKIISVENPRGTGANETQNKSNAAPAQTV